jgi:hypothetical protein
MADEFDDIFGDITPTKTPAPGVASENEEATADEDLKKGPTMSTEFDSMLMELDDAMQTTSTTSVTDDFSDIFGDVSPTRDDGKNKEKDKNKFRSTYEKDDFMGWLKEGAEGADSLSPGGASTMKKRSGSTMSEDFGDIFGDAASTSFDGSEHSTVEKKLEKTEEDDEGAKSGNDDDDDDNNNDDESDVKSGEGGREGNEREDGGDNKNKKKGVPRMFSDDETNGSESRSESESDDDLDFVIHTAPTVITNDNDPNNSSASVAVGSTGSGGTTAPKFFEKKEDGKLKSTEVAPSANPPKTSFLSGITSSSSTTTSTTTNKGDAKASQPTTSKFLSGFASAASSSLSSAMLSTSTKKASDAATTTTTNTSTTANTVVAASGSGGGSRDVSPEKDSNIVNVTIISRVVPQEPDAEEVAALEAAFQAVEDHRKVLAEEKKAAEDAGATVGTRAGHLAALRFRLDTE